MVDVKDGKILRVRPFHFDWKYDREKVRTWKLEKNGKVLEPTWKSLPSPYSLSYKKRTYSPNRIKYPLIRADWDPNGERNPQNRGTSKYRRASWDEVSTIIANELLRVQKKYGNNSVLLQGDGHGECKIINTPHGHPGPMLDHMGGFTIQVRNPDSWEGWYWGAKHVWGQGIQGNYWPAHNIVKDSTETLRDGVVLGLRSGDNSVGLHRSVRQPPVATSGKTSASSRSISAPISNYGAAVHADKWIPVLPNTDAALQLAIAYVWIKEGTYKKDYVETHVVGFDKFSDYVMGKEDGVPKTPEWASKKCGVPEWTIKAFAREFAQQEDLHRPLLWRRIYSRAVVARTGAAGVLPARHAGAGRTRRSPASAHLLRDAALRGAGRFLLVESRADRTALAHRSLFHLQLAGIGPAQNARPYSSACRISR